MGLLWRFCWHGQVEGWRYSRKSLEMLKQCWAEAASFRLFLKGSWLTVRPERYCVNENWSWSTVSILKYFHRESTCDAEIVLGPGSQNKCSVHERLAYLSNIYISLKSTRRSHAQRGPRAAANLCNELCSYHWLVHPVSCSVFFAEC